MEASSQPPTLHFRSISQAAVVLACNGRLIRQYVNGGILMFEVAPPDASFDLDAPDLKVDVQPLLGWTEALATRLRIFTQRKREHEGAR